MSSLEHINVTVESTPSRDNILPILHEIRHALEQLLHHNKPTTIDLHSLPLAKTDIQSLHEVLNEGEVKVEMNSMGKSQIWETRYAGVWWLVHYDMQDRLLNQYLEITRIPPLIQSQVEDIRASMDALQQHLS